MIYFLLVIIVLLIFYWIFRSFYRFPKGMQIDIVEIQQYLKSLKIGNRFNKESFDQKIKELGNYNFKNKKFLYLRCSIRVSNFSAAEFASLKDTYGLVFFIEQRDLFKYRNWGISLIIHKQLVHLIGEI